MQKTANYIETNYEMNDGAEHYEPYPPYYWDRYDYTEETEVLTLVDHVIVSAVDVPFSGHETYIFQCDETGVVLDWSEMPGSFRGALDHERALNGLGYTSKIMKAIGA